MDQSNVEFVILISASIALITPQADDLLLEVFARENYQIKNISRLYVTETGNGGLNIKINGNSLAYNGEYLIKYTD